MGEASGVERKRKSGSTPEDTKSRDRDLVEESPAESHDEGKLPEGLTH
jgi:hypothetical protein